MGESKRKREQGLVQMRRVTPVERVSEPELVYLRRVMAQKDEGVQMEQRAAQLEQEAAQLRQQAMQRYGAHDSWITHLFEQYGMELSTDTIDVGSGVIARASQPKPVPEGAPGDGA